MRTATILAVALLSVAFACKQSETVSTTSSSETTSTVTKSETTTTPVPPVVADTDAMTGTVTTATAVPAETSTKTSTAISSKAAKAAEKLEPVRKVSGQPATEGASGAGPARNLPPPPKSPPPEIEATRTAPVEAKPAVPATSSNASLVSTGQGIFKSQCVACHGADASGNTPIGKKNNIPDYRSTAVQGLSDAELANVIANGKGPVSASAHKSKHLSSDQISAMVAYIRSLK